MFSNESLEMYLESIYVLSKTKANVRSIDVAEYMSFSKASVSRAVGILKNKNFINVDNNGYIVMTPQGKKTAEKIFERHTILTNALMALGISEDIATENACRIEHVITDEAFEVIKQHYNKMKQ